MNIKKVLTIRKGLAPSVVAVLCSILIVMGMAYVVYSSPGTTTIGEDISTTNLTTSGNLEVGGNATTTGNLVVSGNSTLATTTVSNLTVSGTSTLSTTTLSGDLDLSLKQLKNVVLEKLADFPSSPVEGQMFWSTATSTPYWYDEANTRWRTQSHSATFVVAAADSKNPEKADYVCDGIDDQEEIRSAIAALPASGGKIVLTEGTFNLTDAIYSFVSNMTLEGQGVSTVLQVKNEAFTTLTQVANAGQKVLHVNSTVYLPPKTRPQVKVDLRYNISISCTPKLVEETYVSKTQTS